jgi:hypothetical protein
MLTKGVFEELLKTFEECREPNWDGYGAQSVREETYDLAHQFLRALPLSTPVPSIGTEPDGHITVEWYRSPQRTLSVSIIPTETCTMLRSSGWSGFAGRKRSGLECHRC